MDSSHCKQVRCVHLWDWEYWGHCGDLVCITSAIPKQVCVCVCGFVCVCLSTPFKQASSGCSEAGQFKSILLIGCVCVCTNAAYVDFQYCLFERQLLFFPVHDAFGATL